MFSWIMNLQSYDVDGWSYIDKIEEFSTEIFSTGEFNAALISSIDCILRTGSAECDSAVDMTDRLNEVLSLITTLDLPTLSPTTTVSPSASPTYLPTSE